MAIGDQYFDKVVLGCDFETGLVDLSQRTKALTASGNTEVKSDQFKYGARAVFFDGASDYLATSVSSDFNFGTADFTIEFWYRRTSQHAQFARLFTTKGDDSYAGIYIVSSGLALSNELAVSVSSTGSSFDVWNASLSTTIAVDTWYHVAITRQGSTFRAFINGTQVATTTSSASIYYSGSPLTFGGQTGASSRSIYGWLDDIRITKGVARYTTTFAPEQCKFYYGQIAGTVTDANGDFARRVVRAHRRDTGALVGETLSDPSSGAFTLNCPDATKHYAVVHDSDAWITYLPLDGVNNATAFPEWSGKTVTPSGNAKISTAQYAPLTGNTSSAYFDGTGDYLTLPANNDFAFGTADFTVETWVRLDSLATERAIFDNRAAAGDTGLYFGVNASNQLFAFGNNATIVTASTAIASSLTWYHVALVKSSGTMTLFLGGASVGSSSSSYTITCPGSVVFGRKLGSTTNDFIGYIDDLRITKGVARYLGNFTVPAVPHFTEQYGDRYWNSVVLGMHMDDTGLTDIKGHTVTLNGNATRSATQAKFGGYSAYFDGTGDYLGVASSMALGAGDFTIEAQVYVSTLNKPILSSRLVLGSAIPYWILSTEADGKLSMQSRNSGGTQYYAKSGAGAIATNTWCHIAAVRLAGTLSVFVNGVVGPTTASDGGNNLTEDTLAIGLFNFTGFVDYFNGYIDDLRITKGVARYTADFTPPTAAFPESLPVFGQQNALIYDHLTPV